MRPCSMLLLEIKLLCSWADLHAPSVPLSLSLSLSRPELARVAPTFSTSPPSSSSPLVSRPQTSQDKANNLRKDERGRLDIHEQSEIMT
jgi:hypothetical protein